MKFINIIFLLFVFLLGCEDNKKTPLAEPLKLSDKKEIKLKDSPSKQEVLKKVTNGKLERLNSDNVVELLTQYGKENPENKVRIKTTFGNIEITLFKNTPLHRANFIYLVKQHYFDKTFFHRVVPNFIIQGGNSDNASTNKKRAKIGKYRIPFEIHPKNKHRRGTLSGAKYYRDNPDNKSEPYEFFIFLGPQSSTLHLNGSYTVFGEVTQGMNVVDKIANLPSDDGDWPLDNVYIYAEIIE